MNILMVCTGNICRSPTAEAVFRHVAKQRCVADIMVDSAGTQDYHKGEPADPRTIAAAKKRNISVTGKARKVTKEDFYNFDFIFAMDDGHYNMLRHLQPKDSKSKVSLFLKYAGVGGRKDQLLDPYYGPPAGFEAVLDQCEAASNAILDKWEKEKQAAPEQVS